MRISVKRSGGFAGLDERATVDTTNNRALEPLVRDARFFALPARLGAEGLDFVLYEVEVVDGERRHTVTFPDDGSPETRALLRLARGVLPG